MPPPINLCVWQPVAKMMSPSLKSFSVCENYHHRIIKDEGKCVEICLCLHAHLPAVCRRLGRDEDEDALCLSQSFVSSQLIAVAHAYSEGHLFRSTSASLKNWLFHHLSAVRGMLWHLNWHSVVMAAIVLNGFKLTGEVGWWNRLQPQ